MLAGLSKSGCGFTAMVTGTCLVQVLGEAHFSSADGGRDAVCGHSSVPGFGISTPSVLHCVIVSFRHWLPGAMLIVSFTVLDALLLAPGVGVGGSGEVLQLLVHFAYKLAATW